MLVLWATAAFAVVAWEFPAAITLASVSGTQIKVEDVLFVVFAFATLLRPQRLIAIAQRYTPVLALIAICLIASLVVGVITFGSAAVNEARQFLWGVGLVAWMLNLDWSDPVMQHRLLQWARVVGWTLVLVFVYHAARYGMGTADSFVEVGDGQSQTGRPLISQQAILLACIGFMMFLRTGNLKPRVFSGVAFLVVAALCQHRSVWVALGVGAVLALLKLRGRALGATVSWGLYGCLIAAIFYAAGAFDSLIEPLTHAATSAGTYTERADSWQLLIDQAISKGPGTVIMGEPLGAGYDRVVDGRFVTYSPHNWFVMVFLRLGLVGFLAYMLVMMGLVLPKLLKANGVAAAMFIAVLAYSWTYSMPWYLSPITGWCIYEAWRVRNVKRGPRPAKAWTLPSTSKDLAARPSDLPARTG